MRNRYHANMQDPAWREREAERQRIKERDRYHGVLKFSADYWQRHTEVTGRYRYNNPEKYRAHIAVGNAVRSGRLKKPDGCEQCGGPPPVHGHHDDYAKPLDVRWLCVACHSLEHRKAA